jgi:hypothetical protein
MQDNDGAVPFKSCTLGDAGTADGAGPMRFDDDWRTATFYKGALNHADLTGRHGDFCCGADSYVNAGGEVVNLWEDDWAGNDDCKICKDWSLTPTDRKVIEENAEDECGGCGETELDHKCIPAHEEYGTGRKIAARCKCKPDWHGKHCEFAPLEWAEHMSSKTKGDISVKKGDPTMVATKHRITCKYVERTDTCPMRFLSRTSRRNDIKVTKGTGVEKRQEWCDSMGGTGDRQRCADNNGACHKDAICTQKPYSPHTSCKCKKGYTGNGRTCRVYDMCGIGTQNGGCGHDSTCANGRDAEGKPTGEVPTCQCHEGFKDHVPAGNLANRNTGDARNAQKPESHRSGSSCRRLCSEGNGGCHQNAFCEQDRPGLTACKCMAGYKGMGIGDDGCKLINLCLEGHVSGCHEHADCHFSGKPDRFAQTHNCTCKEGYRGDGYECTPVDVCADKDDECSDHSVCKYQHPCLP